MSTIFFSLPEDFITLNDQVYYTVRAIATHLKVSGTTITNHIKSGKLPAIQQPGYLSNKKLVSQADLIKYIQRQ